MGIWAPRATSSKLEGLGPRQGAMAEDLLNMVAAMMEEELSDLTRKFKLSTALSKDLGSAMKKRQNSFEEDMRVLKIRLTEAEDRDAKPEDVVRRALSDMEKGTFNKKRSRSRSGRRRPGGSNEPRARTLLERF